MVRITEDIIRKRAEHNECIISSLEEISLHQQDIEKIEYLDKWCRELRILYLQNNLIPRIENVGRLKKLEYLNLALNNIEVIENLEGCESLQKLDLTVNFIGELTSIETLKDLYHLRLLYLTGNPCTEFEGYRDYVIATLPQLQSLDGKEIEKSERILAIQKLASNRAGIIEQQRLYKKKREKQKLEEESKQNGNGNKKKGKDGRWYTDIGSERNTQESDDEKTREEETDDREFWEEKVAYTPESRLRVHEHMKEAKKKEEKQYPDPNPPKRERRLQTEDGRILNVNEGHVDFTLQEDYEHQTVVLDVAVFKYLDTSLCDVDVQPTYVKVVMKGKVLQLTLPEEVKPDSSSAKRSQTTGHLVITMPKAFPIEMPIIHPEDQNTLDNDKNKENTKKGEEKIERLEVDPSLNKGIDFGNIVSKEGDMPKVPLIGASQFNRKRQEERPNSDGFVDDPDVPPLE